MIDIIGKKNWYYLFSLVIIIPGILSLILFGLNLSIDFTGGTRITYMLNKTVDKKTITRVEDVFRQEKVRFISIQPSGKQVLVRTALITQKENAILTKKLQKSISNLKQESFETIGPVVGAETTQKAFQSVIISSILILIYIAISFRKVPKPTNSWRFGIATIIALLHDVLVLVGIFSILGHFLSVEIDSLFITAVLTVMGFSVHDTIVVFDRVRENLQKVGGVSFEQVVNESILQTFVRSLNTSLTALLVLFALLLFGGESIHWFVLALLIGIASGTYSSIFNAAPILVTWHELRQKRLK
jgi:preprotein translocase subunit SecF